MIHLLFIVVIDVVVDTFHLLLFVVDDTLLLVHCSFYGGCYWLNLTLFQRYTLPRICPLRPFAGCARFVTLPFAVTHRYAVAVVFPVVGVRLIVVTFVALPFDFDLRCCLLRFVLITNVVVELPLAILIYVCCCLRFVTLRCYRYRCTGYFVVCLPVPFIGCPLEPLHFADCTRLLRCRLYFDCRLLNCPLRLLPLIVITRYVVVTLLYLFVYPV